MIQTEIMTRVRNYGEGTLEDTQKNVKAMNEGD